MFHIFSKLFSPEPEVLIYRSDGKKKKTVINIECVNRVVLCLHDPQFSRLLSEVCYDIKFKHVQFISILLGDVGKHKENEQQQEEQEDEGIIDPETIQNLLYAIRVDQMKRQTKRIQVHGKSHIETNHMIKPVDINLSKEGEFINLLEYTSSSEHNNICFDKDSNSYIKVIHEYSNDVEHVLIYLEDPMFFKFIQEMLNKINIKTIFVMFEGYRKDKTRGKVTHKSLNQLADLLVSEHGDKIRMSLWNIIIN